MQYDNGTFTYLKKKSIESKVVFDPIDLRCNIAFAKYKHYKHAAEIKRKKANLSCSKQTKEQGTP